VIGLAVPGRPIRSLLAEDRSAEGVRDRTGPKDAAAPRSRLANDAVVIWDGPHPPVEAEPPPPGRNHVVLIDRAIRVP
jgi:hypothetical protein